MPSFPVYRGRRLRRTEPLRRLVRETTLLPSQLVLPLFARNGSGLRRPIGSMPGVAKTSHEEIVRDATRADEAGIGGVIQFGIQETKDTSGSIAFADDGVVQ